MMLFSACAAFVQRPEATPVLSHSCFPPSIHLPLSLHAGGEEGMTGAFVVVFPAEHFPLDYFSRTKTGLVVVIKQPYPNSCIGSCGFMNCSVVFLLPFDDGKLRLPVAPSHDVQPYLAQIS